MASKLKTEWMRIGRSGNTIDGRKIEPEMLTQAAKNYKKELFTALVWPDHIRMYNMGLIDSLRSAPNEEGGVDLFAIIAPNDIYLNTNASGQRLFTSMELMPNFRESGEWYLTGLAATDTPASVATSEMRFSKIDNTALVSVFTEHLPHQFNDDKAPGWFMRFAEKFTLKPDEDDAMNKEALDALAAKFTALEQRLAALTPPPDDAASKPDDATVALTKKIDVLAAQFEAFTAKQAEAPPTDQVTALKNELEALRADFTAAVSAADGTHAGEHSGDGVDLSTYL